MKLNKTEKALEDFGNYVIQQSRSKLTKGKSNYTKELYNSLKYTIEKSEDGVIIDFYMEEYGAFQDKGVKGVKSNYTENKNTPFSYKPSSNLKGLEYKTKIFSKWAKYRKLQPRDKKGRFGTYETMGYILANSIKNKGIKATFFFTKPFEAAVKRLPNELFDSFIIDVETSILLAQKK
jgi:activator of 2-hydroxyglutaryl-CoA dehydratase